MAARTLVRKARALLEAARVSEGVSVARSAIEADASERDSYVLLVAELQDLGRWAEASQVFKLCVRRSLAAANSECAYCAQSEQQMGGAEPELW